jgi:hypothetical protein
VKERMLRALSSEKSIECHSKIRYLRVKLINHIKQKKKTARKQAVIRSSTSEGKTYNQNPLVTNLL